MKRIAKISQIALVAAMLGAAPNCFAQENESAAEAETGGTQAPTTEVIVTGIRESEAESIDIKRRSKLIVDSIVAEDIGKLPDQNVAESLERVSGVQVRREIDEAADIAIRGLSQNRLEFNGHTLISPYGRGADGPDEGAYNVLTLIPSELVARMDVTKLPSPSMIEGSLGGTVNILTRRASSRKKFFIGGSAQIVDKSKAGDPSYRLTGLVAASFLDGRLGVAIGANYQRLNIGQDSFDSFSSWREQPDNFSSDPDVVDPNGDGNNIYYFNDIRYQRLQEKRTKYGATANIFFEANDSLEFHADLLYAHADTDRKRNWVSIPLSRAASGYTDLVVSENENIVAGTVRAVIQGNAERLTLPTDIFSGQFGVKGKLGDRIELSSDVSFTRATQDYGQTYLRADTTSAQLVSFDFRDRDVPAVGLPANVDITDPALYIYRTSFDNRYLYEAEEATFRLDARYSFDRGFLTSIEAGYRFAQIDLNRETYRNQTTYPTGASTRIPVTSIPGNYEIVEFDRFLTGAQGDFPTSYLVPITDKQGNEGICQVFSSTCTPNLYDPTSSFTLREPVHSAYVQGNFETKLFAVPVSGNFGLRYVNTRLIADGFYGIRGSTTLGAFEPVNQTVAYDDWLPSVATRFEVSDSVLFRLGAARVMARPDTRDQSPSFSITSAGTGAGGNPALQPFRVNQLDASIEWYPRRGALWSLAAFYKDVESFIYSQTVEEVIPGLDADPNDSDPETPYRIGRTFNGQGATIKGFEVQIRQPLDFLPGPLENLGVKGTYTFIDSKSGIIDGRTNDELPLQSLSKHSGTALLFYEEGPFGMRVGYSYRSGFLNRIGLEGNGIYYKAAGYLSAGVDYDIAKGVKISIAGSNLTNTPTRKFANYEEAIASYLENGRSITGTLTFRF
ncbi:TonB-dependent receptor [Sphingomonas sp. ST-64]|uniref:TonB-dependent receptor n=1 Tax=Sphingomonas plantiphila TaxID=3163295 RepID=A0ABW8YJF4_9SPHN